MKIAVAMSGGVDSTVASILLRAQGHSLVGVFMHNWDLMNEGQCSADEDYSCVQHVCKEIDIPCQRLDLSKEYWNDVFSQYVEGLRAGINLNPDILCNQHIKFKALFNHLTSSSLNVDRIATGHYARLRHLEDGSVKMLQAADLAKDQSYFLSRVPQSSLQRTLFPVGHMTKEAVRRVAYDFGLRRVAEKKESYGLCFVGKRKFVNFISNYVEEKHGDFISLDGEVLGHHLGQHLYTIGQRARLPGHSVPYFVISKCPGSNVVTVVKGHTHPALYTQSFLTTPPHWIHHSYSFEGCKSKHCLVRTNYRKELVKAELVYNARGFLTVSTASPLRAVTPGQYAVFYSAGECLGASRIIKSRLSPSSESEH